MDGARSARDFPWNQGIQISIQDMSKTKLNRKLRAALLLRVSTDEQTLGYGLEYQEQRLRAFIASQEYIFNEGHIYKDEGYSGSLPIRERPALKKLLEDAEKKQFDIVLVYKLDRLARKLKIVLDVVERLTEFGVGFRSTTELFDTSISYGRYALQMMGAAAELERENIQERTSGGRLMAAKAGKWVMGTPPYGYKVNKKTQKLEIVPEQAKWIKKFYEWLVYEKCSLKEIARRANNLRVPTWTQATKTKRKSKTKLWWSRTLGRTLSNETYAGVAYFRKYKKVHRDIRLWTDPNRLRPEDEWVPIEVPVIVSHELFRAALEQLKKNSEFAKRKKKRDYMFSGLMYCGACGFRMKGGFHNPKTPNSVGSRYYNGYVPRRDRGRSKRCDYCGVVAETRLMPVWNALQVVLSNPDFIYEKIKRHSQKKVERARIDERLAEIEKELKSLERQRQRITVAFIELNELGKNEYSKRLNENDVLREKLAGERAKLKQSLISSEEKVERVEYLERLFKKLKKKLEEASYETKTQILRLFVARIDLNLQQNCAETTFNFAGGTEFLRDNRLGRAGGHHGVFGHFCTKRISAI